MKQELSKTYASRSELCEFATGPFDPMKINLESIINPYYPELRSSQWNSWFFGNSKNVRK